jgi:beta-glucosidase
VSQPLRFPPDFLWGAATSAYQIEGSPLADGAGANIWHRFAHVPGTILNGDTGDLACDHYRRYADDVELVRTLGLPAYRFSLAWARLLPEGRGGVNPQGVGFYDRLIDRLCAAGITPFVTLYHWDLPATLEDRGGWLNDDVAGWFAEYAELVFRCYDDRVRFWATLNEPAIVTEKGYLLGLYAPGHRAPSEAPVVARNLLRAHGAAVSAYRALGKNRIGLVENLQPKQPASDHPDDRAAALRADAFRNRQFLDPVLLGRSPEELPGMFGSDWRPLSEADLALVHRPIDFIGVNYYTRNVIGHDPTVVPIRARTVATPERPHTLMGWEVYPAGLTQMLRRVTERYGRIPLYVTENGAAFTDPPASDGRLVDDPERVAFLRAHLEAAHRALAAGVDLRGFFVWSLLDNFEWSSGFGRPFGLVQVDFRSQRRTPKTSASFFAEVARSSALPPAP